MENKAPTIKNGNQPNKLISFGNSDAMKLAGILKFTIIRYEKELEKRLETKKPTPRK